MAIALALCSALAWGWSDFIGGITSRREHHVTVALWSQVLGVVPFLTVAFLFAPLDSVGRVDVTYGALAGLGGALGLVMLFRGLSVGRMAVVAPITALGGAGLPVLWGALVDGDVPGPLTWAGLATALVAIGLVSAAEDPTAPDSPARGTGIAEALAASVGFAIVFIALDRTGADSGLWPLLPARIVVVALVTALAFAQRAPRLPTDAQSWRPLAAIAVLDTTAISAYLLASKQGLLAIVAVVASMYPAGTVVLARVRLKEHLTRSQLAGLGLAGAAVTLIAVG